MPGAGSFNLRVFSNYSGLPLDGALVHPDDGSADHTSGDLYAHTGWAVWPDGTFHGTIHFTVTLTGHQTATITQVFDTITPESQTCYLWTDGASGGANAPLGISGIEPGTGYDPVGVTPLVVICYDSPYFIYEHHDLFSDNRMAASLSPPLAGVSLHVVELLFGPDDFMGTSGVDGQAGFTLHAGNGLWFIQGTAGGHSPFFDEVTRGDIIAFSPRRPAIWWFPMFQTGGGGGGGGGDYLSTSGLDTVVQPVGGKFCVARYETPDVVVDTYALSAAAEWALLSTVLTIAAADTPSISCLKDNSLLLCCHNSSGVRVSRWNPSRGEYAVQNVFNGIVPDHILDRNGRLIVVGYITTAWFVSVGTLGADGGLFTFSAPVQMKDATGTSIGGVGRQSSIRELPDGSLQFVYQFGDAVIVRKCRSLSNAGIGAWV